MMLKLRGLIVHRPFHDYTKSTPRPIIVAFLPWDDANTILSNAQRALKNNPPKDKVGGSMEAFIDQLRSPKFLRLDKKP